jgi:RecA/RadA recombinase
MDKETELLKAALKAKRPVVGGVPTKDLLSTGSTLLNLAATNKPNGGFGKGKYFLVVGDSTAGKTFLVLTTLAEACINRNFDNYDIVFDNNEDGALMDIERYYGKGLEERLLAPAWDEDTGLPLCSSTAEQFYYNLDTWLKRCRKKGRSLIYVLDSENGLSSGSEEEKFQEQKVAHEKGKEAAGSYGDGKAKIHSSNLRRIMPELKETGSILIIVSQTRDNLGFGHEKKTRSGGKALKFYATVEIWMSVKEKLKLRVKGKDRTVGVLAEVRMKKNRFTGKDRTVTIPIYHSSGLDDVGACVDYLIEEDHWEQAKGEGYVTTEFGGVRERDEIIKYIEDNNLEKDLRSIVAEVWAEIEAACVVERKPRYGQ